MKTREMVINKLTLKNIADSIKYHNPDYIRNCLYARNVVGCYVNLTIDEANEKFTEWSIGKFIDYIINDGGYWLLDFPVKNIAIYLRNGKIYGLYDYDLLRDFINDIINYFPVEYILEDLKHN